MRQVPALVITRDYVHRDAALGDASQRLKRLIRQTRIDTRSVEHVAAMHDDIDGPVKRRLEGRHVIGEKVVAAATTLDARTHWQVEAEVRVSEEQNAYDVGHRQQATREARRGV